MNRRIAAALVTVTLLLLVTGCGKYADEGANSQSAAGGNSTSSTSSSNNTGAGSTSPSTSSTSVGGGGSSSNSTGGSTGGTTTAGAGQTNQQQEPVYEKVNLTGLKPGDSAKVGPITVTLKQTNVVTNGAGLPPGYVHLMTEIDVTNEGSDLYTINMTDHFKLETPEGKKAPYNVTATANRSPRLQGSLEQGKSATGWIGYLSKSVAGNYKYSFIHPDYGQATWEFAIQ